MWTVSDGILADLGVSFHHFDDTERGFSFRFNGPLDMRMNRQAPHSAADLVNTLPEEKIADILYIYGELKQSRAMARSIARARQSSPLTTIGQLVECVKPHIDPRKEKRNLPRFFRLSVLKSMMKWAL